MLLRVFTSALPERDKVAISLDQGIIIEGFVELCLDHEPGNEAVPKTMNTGDVSNLSAHLYALLHRHS